MKQFVRYNNNRNRIFVINCYKNTIKITTYRKGINNCLKVNSVKYFPKGSVINFSGDNPTLYIEQDTTTYSAKLWNAQHIYSQWKELVNSGNEWTLYQKGILEN